MGARGEAFVGVDIGGTKVAAGLVSEHGELLYKTRNPMNCLRGSDEADVVGLIESAMPTVPTEEELPELARLMSDFNLIAMPVLDDDGKPVGMIAVDDVLEQLVPEEWRWRAGAARD